MIAENADPGNPRLLWVFLITSAANRSWSGDVPVSNLEADAASRIGYLEEADWQKVSERIRRLLHPAGICLPD